MEGFLKNFLRKKNCKGRIARATWPNLGSSFLRRGFLIQMRALCNNLYDHAFADNFFGHLREQL